MAKILTSALLLTALAAAAADPEKLKAVAKDAIDLAKDQEGAIEVAAAEVVNLQAQIESLKSGKKILPSFVFKKGAKSTEYEVLHAVNVDGQHFNPEQIAENASVQKQLVEGGSSAIKEKVTE